jgi:hypothetical protein
MIGPRSGLKTPLRVGLAVGVVSDEISAGGGGAPTLVSIDVTPDTTTWRPTLSTDRQQMTATGTYSDLSTADITADVTWSSGTPTVATISNGAGTEGEVTPLLVGDTLITATLGAVSGNETLTLDVDVDATSGKGVPSTEFQFTMLGVTLTSAWLAQEASGNLAGLGPSAFTLTANATPLYQQAVTGWTRTASAFNQASGQRFAATSGTGPNPSSTSVLWLGYMVADTIPGGVRGLMNAAGGAGTGVAIGYVNGSGNLRLHCVLVETERHRRPDQAHRHRPQHRRPGHQGRDCGRLAPLQALHARNGRARHQALQRPQRPHRAKRHSSPLGSTDFRPPGAAPHPRDPFRPAPRVHALRGSLRVARTGVEST